MHQDLENKLVEPQPGIAPSDFTSKKGTSHFSLPVSWLVLICIYTVAVLFGWLFVTLFSFVGHLLTRSLIADVLVTCIIFLFSLIFQNSSIYDPYVSVANIAISWYWYENLGSHSKTHAILGVIAITLFSLRRLIFYFRAWPGLSFEDERYVRTKTKYRESIWTHWLISFSLYHMLNTLVFFAGLIPLYYVLESTVSNHFWLLIVGFVVCCFGIIFEAAGFWFGLWLMAMGCHYSLWWTVIGPIVLTSILFFTSYPYMEYRLFRGERVLPNI